MSFIDRLKHGRHVDKKDVSAEFGKKVLEFRTINVRNEGTMIYGVVFCSEDIEDIITIKNTENNEKTTINLRVGGVINVNSKMFKEIEQCIDGDHKLINSAEALKTLQFILYHKYLKIF